MCSAAPYPQQVPPAPLCPHKHAGEESNWHFKGVSRQLLFPEFSSVENSHGKWPLILETALWFQVIVL